MGEEFKQQANARPCESGRLPKSSALLVLVVDDSPDNREMYVQYLELSGYRTVEAGDGVAAVQTARREMPDAVIMDLTLPLMDGWEAARLLKAEPDTAAIPLIAISGFAIGESEAKDAGFEATLEKPCAPDRLALTVAALIRTTREKQSESA